MRLQNRSFSPLLVIAGLAAGILACGGRVFTETQVFSLREGSQSDFYDAQRDALLADDVWVFRSDGSYAARLTVTGSLMELSGRYEGDDAGGDFFMFFDTDGDGELDDQIVLADDNSYIEWEYEDDVYRFMQAP